ncbi:MAG: DNA polymerase III subunit gamma/tau, partial [Chloroflexota bacterium]
MSSTAPHQALYRRWRAQTFGQIVGQEAVVDTLRNAVRLNQVAHALLFVGPRGTGKTSLARIVAKALNCTDLRDGEPCDRCPACVSIREGRALDVIEMDAASNNRVDDMRELLARTLTAPSDLRRKVYIVDEVQRIKEGWDVLLKSLEEPPEHVVFVFCTTDASQIRPAVLSRVQRYDFRRLTVPQIEGKLRMILEADGRAAEPEALGLVARLAAGGMRDAESMLDQLLASGADPLPADHVRDLLGLAEIESVERFVDALVLGDVLTGIAILDELEEHGRDLRSFLDQAAETIRTALVDALSGRTKAPVRAPAGQLVSAGRRLGEIDPTRGGPGGLRFQLELALFASPGAGTGSAAVREPVATVREPVGAVARPARRPQPPGSPPTEPSPVAESAVAPSSRAPDSPAPPSGPAPSAVASPTAAVGEPPAAPGQPPDGPTP